MKYGRSCSLLKGNGLIRQRRAQIKQILDSKGEVLLKDLEKLFADCSSMTLRRDLKYLEDTGVVKRIRGGAVALSQLSLPTEDIDSRRVLENIDAKELIAKKAVSFVESGRSLYMDSGTTMMVFARAVPDDAISLLTCGPNIALELLKKARPTVMLVGGQLERNTISISGSSAIRFLSGINIDTAFMASSGFTLSNGFTCETLADCELKREVFKRASKVIMLMDSLKVGRSLAYTFGSLNDIDILVSDDKLPESIVRAAQSVNTRVL